MVETPCGFDIFSDDLCIFYLISVSATPIASTNSSMSLEIVSLQSFVLINGDYDRQQMKRESTSKMLLIIL
ncbi:hypothetical protein L6452_02704 [Arctium lappa]|uniref:Uncharacterized protein n=1 Tax=Arctium lappa TaxID=4217 RepID=A0ACB9FJU0_ARCLA|nr:hypothetical protein L6452_02704 [Arctium lappa]